MIILDQVKKVFQTSSGQVTAVDSVNLEIKKGEIFGIIGYSGAGKSTLIRMLNLLERPTDGTVTIDGKDLTKVSAKELRLARQQIGMVFQQPIAFPYSIEKNLSYVLKYHGIREAGEIERITRECLQKARLYDEIKDQLKKSAKKLSGGQKQRLAIARSLCVNPEILLLDEPCSALDMKNTIAIEETLLELKGKYTFVIVTHNLAQAKRIADQIIFMDQGRVLEVTDTKTFFEHPSSEPAREQIQYM